MVKNPPTNTRDIGSERVLGEGNGNPLQDYCLENPRDRGTRWATVHGVSKSRIQLKRLSIHLWGKGLEK